VIGWQKNALTTTGRKYAILQIAVMLFSVLTCAFASYLFLGLSYAYSITIGGLVAIVPNVVFAYKAFKYAGASKARLVTQSFFSGAKIRLLLTAVLFALAFKFLVLVPLAFLAGFCLVMVLPLLIPIFIKI